jgi:exodeoxyribonuclease VIII
MLEVFRESPARYHGRFITGTLPAPGPTPAMEFGTLFHLYFLERFRFHAECALIPRLAPDGKKWDRRGKEHKEFWAQWEASINGRQQVDETTFELLRAMDEGVDRCPSAHALLTFDSGPVEQTIHWTDDETGLPCKARLDKLARGGAVIVDLKTCQDSTPEAFARYAVNFGLHRQAAFYLDGFAAAHNVDATGMVFVAVSKEAPHDVAAYSLDMDAIELGRKQNRATMRKLADAIEKDTWDAPHQRCITEISLAAWAFSSDRYELE